MARPQWKKHVRRRKRPQRDAPRRTQRRQTPPPPLQKRVPCPQPSVPNQLVSGATEAIEAITVTPAYAARLAKATRRTPRTPRKATTAAPTPRRARVPVARRTPNAHNTAKAARTPVMVVFTGSKVLRTPGRTTSGPAARSAPRNAVDMQRPSPRLATNARRPQASDSLRASRIPNTINRETTVLVVLYSLTLIASHLPYEYNTHAKLRRPCSPPTPTIPRSHTQPRTQNHHPPIFSRQWL